ncbi:uncharacterized protein LOC122930634 [Bufo gargarizans]|uniref:uncharacterized protein LOC122930634 n=1 Tax=Bufo gargarizans TaxID=30331 RepID=UPI001CF2F5F3|nr:uncharacterized protein LOC122930634 [Bufo gargarizans]
MSAMPNSAHGGQGPAEEDIELTPSGEDCQVMAPSDQSLAFQASLSNAIAAAMESMTSVISQSIAQALAAHPAASQTPQPAMVSKPAGPGPSASRKRINGDDVPTNVGALGPRKRACMRQAERTHNWKCARAQQDVGSDSEVGSDEEAVEDAFEEAEEDPSGVMDHNPLPGCSSLMSAAEVIPASLTDPSGEPLFDPDSLHHPRSSAEWLPLEHVSKYLEARVRCPLSKEARNKLRAECPRPVIPNKVCETPSVDPKMTQFLTKSGWNPRRGLESALRSCQDKLLDIFGPLAKLLDLAEVAKAENRQVDPVEVREWVQRAICIAGNANTSLAIERRKAILFKIEPKLSNLALTEAGKEAQGLLFGESFIKDLGRFTALDKAQSSMKRVFHGRVSTRAGSFRGRLSGRAQFQSRGSGRGSFSQRSAFQEHRREPTSFFFPLPGEVPGDQEDTEEILIPDVPTVETGLVCCLHLSTSWFEGSAVQFQPID